MRLYVASSWRNQRQPEVVEALRAEHEVYDFRNPSPGDKGFAWSEIDPDWATWSASRYMLALAHPVARAGFVVDAAAMEHAEACVLVLPCGRSAHLEAGWFVGRGRPLYILLDDPPTPELMYRFATSICSTVPDVLDAIAGRSTFDQ